MDANHDLDTAHARIWADEMLDLDGEWQSAFNLAWRIISAVRADERRASEERERGLRAALEKITRADHQQNAHNDRTGLQLCIAAHHGAIEIARRALLIPENAGDKEGEA